MVNKKFIAKRNELIKKYWDGVAGISEAENVDIGVSFEMLLTNLRNRGKNYEQYSGAENVDYNELARDVAELDKLRR